MVAFSLIVVEKFRKGTDVRSLGTFTSKTLAEQKRGEIRFAGKRGQPFIIPTSEVPSFIASRKTGIFKPTFDPVKAREEEAAKIRRQKEQAQKEPEFLITDGRHSYTNSIKKEMPETNHIRLTSIQDKRTNNNNIERLNGTIRDRVKVMRGMQNIETAEIMTSGYRNYYNFIREHSAIGMTPSEKAGIGIGTESNRWMALLKKSF